jgi:hypothetical protein
MGVDGLFSMEQPEGKRILRIRRNEGIFPTGDGRKTESF